MCLRSQGEDCTLRDIEAANRTKEKRQVARLGNHHIFNLCCSQPADSPERHCYAFGKGREGGINFAMFNLS